MKHCVPIWISIFLAMGCNNNRFFAESKSKTPDSERDINTEFGTIPQPTDLSDEEAEAIIKTCANPANYQYLDIPLVFGEHNDTCKFGLDGNGDRKDQFLQARFRKDISGTLPAGATFCDLTLSSASSSLQYDDMLFFTLNNLVLASSHRTIIDRLKPQSTGHKLWFFPDVVGSPVTLDNNNIRYCGPGVTCVLPPHDTEGAFSLQGKTTSKDSLGVALGGKPSTLTFSLIAGGDNDDGDCFYTAFNLNAKVGYVNP